MTLAAERPLNVLVWHVHGAWLTAFVQGRHRYFIPALPGVSGGRRRPEWPASVEDLEPDRAAGVPIDVIVFQRESEMADASRWLGNRVPGRDIPMIFVEHNTPQGKINEMRHPLADRDDLTIVHVTHFNAMMWETGSTRVRIIEHGIPDTGYRYTGESERIAVVINEAERRRRVVGLDLLPAFAQIAPIDRFGIGTDRDLPQERLYSEISQRRLYLHPFRWTSLGLALLEAMCVGMPVVALATTEVPAAVPADAGIVSNRMDVLTDGLRMLLADPERARQMGRRGRAHVLEHYGLEAFLRKFDALFAELVAGSTAVTAAKRAGWMRNSS